MSAKDRPPEPWESFLAALDTAVGTPVAIYCLGGFVVEHVYLHDPDLPNMAPPLAKPVEVLRKSAPA